MVAVAILSVIALTAPVITLLLLQWQWSNAIGRAGGDFVMEAVVAMVTRAGG